MRGIVAGTAIAQADVEKTVGTEREVPAVVVRERLRDERRAARPFQRRSNRESASAIRGSANRRYRATTVSPAGLVKFTKKRPLAASGANASPSKPRSPPAATARVRSRNAAGSRAPLRTARIVPFCSTTNWTDRSAGSCTKATGDENPDA